MSARVAVTGCGLWSTETHLPALAADDRATVVALVNPGAARLATAAARFGVEATYADVGDMLERTPSRSPIRGWDLRSDQRHTR
jgi:predicted dehydrogenase